jgi:glycosyltransferase involved in cell wall biosynthesis
VSVPELRRLSDFTLADLEGIRDVIEDGVNGWFAPTEDADAFAARIRALLDDPTEVHAASERTAEYVKNTFTWDKTAARYLDALRGQ